MARTHGGPRVVRGILIFGYGNPGRGDDALGPEFVARLEQEGMDASGDVECLTDMQLQVEHVTDLCGRRLVLFIDADAACPPPFLLSRIRAEKDGSYTSHAMTPEALLFAYRQVYGTQAPPAFLLRIRGHGFDLGDPLSDQAAANLKASLAMTRGLCADADPERWQRAVDSGAAVGACG
jgi:hydrogenase maturation protease